LDARADDADAAAAFTLDVTDESAPVAVDADEAAFDSDVAAASFDSRADAADSAAAFLYSNASTSAAS